MFKENEIEVAGLLQPRGRAAVRRGRGCRNIAARRHEAVAEAADRLDYVVTAERLEELAQPADVNVDGAAAGRDVLWPRAAQQLVAAEYAPLVLEQKREQTKLGWRQRDLLAKYQQAVDALVEDERAGGQLIGLHGCERTPQAGIHARDELRGLERQRQAIVGAG